MSISIRWVFPNRNWPFLGISRRLVNEIVNGQRAISADTALKLAAHFRTTPMFWLEKQQLWELYWVIREEKPAL